MRQISFDIKQYKAMSSYVMNENGTVKAVFHYELDCTPEEELARIDALLEKWNSEGVVNNPSYPVDTEASNLI
jgi:hypothetical protein